MTHSPGGVSETRFAIAAWIASMLRRSQFTCTSSETPPEEGWVWASMNPGVTVIPSASMSSVEEDARFRTSELDPTATKRPFFTANASALGRSGSMV
jgi:hypothetical protein